MSDERSERVRIRRETERARYDQADVQAVLDDGVLAHVGFNASHGVVVIPMLYAPCPGGLYLHGSPGSGVLRNLRSVPACVTVTLFDGLVVARSTFMTSANYRCVVAFGHARRLGEDEKVPALDALVEHILPGRGAEVRPPTREELNQTGILLFEIEEASAKIRQGDSEDHPEDVNPAVSAGVVPTPLTCAPPIGAPDVGPGVAPPPSVGAFVTPAPATLDTGSRFAAVSTTDALALAAAIVACVGAVVVLVAAVVLVGQVRRFERGVETLRGEVLEAVRDVRAAAGAASGELARVDAVLTDTESVTATVDHAARLAQRAFANPVVKLLAWRAGARGALSRLAQPAPSGVAPVPAPAPAPGPVAAEAPAGQDRHRQRERRRAAAASRRASAEQSGNARW